MILHIARDEKFIDRAIELFEKVSPGENKYIIWDYPERLNIPSILNPLNYDDNNNLKSRFNIKNERTDAKLVRTKIDNVFFSTFFSDKFFKEIGDLSVYKAVVFHSLVYNQSKIVNAIKRRFSVPIVWIPFGFEVYNMIIKSSFELYQKQTKRYLRNPLNFIKHFNPFDHCKAKAIKKAIENSDICALAIYDEFLLYQRILSLKAINFWFTYYPIEQIVFNNNEFINGTNLIIGNSSTPTNNHLDSFLKVRKLNILNRKIIVPLGYGNTHYKNKINIKGIKYFGDNYSPLNSFLSLNDYNKVLLSGSIVIMNSNRQQAFGNILASIWFGAKVYLNESNTIYLYLKRIGIQVFSINTDLVPSNKFVLEKLNTNQQIQNREILKKEFGHEKVLIKTMDLIKFINQKSNEY